MSHRFLSSSTVALSVRSRATTSLFVASLLLSLAGGCRPPGAEGQSNDGESGESGDEEAKPVPVAVAKVERGSIVASIASASTIEAERAVTVHAEATGRIVKLDVEEGQKVKQGQLLARIRYDSQSSLLERAHESLAKAQTDLARVQSLHARGVASDQDLAEAQNQLDMARLDSRDRKRDVSNTRVVAPFRGTLTERSVIEGAFVSSGSQLFSLVDFDTLVARVYVPEKELDRIRVGQPAKVVGKAARGRQGTGMVSRIAPIVDAATGTVKVTVSLPSDENGTAGGFLPGMYAEVTLTTEKRDNALLLSKTALVRDEERVYVYTLDGDKAKRVLVELGLEDDDRVEIVSGLEAGQTVIIAGHDGLQDGATVVLVDEHGEPVAGQAPVDKTVVAGTDSAKQGGPEGT